MSKSGGVNIKDLSYTLTDNNLHIEDSWKVGKCSFEVLLLSIWFDDKFFDEREVWKRSITSLKYEWAVHNFLYSLGLWRSRTGSVDLDMPCDRPEWVYRVLGFLVWPFIK